MARSLEVDETGIRAASLAETREDLNERQVASYGGDLALGEPTPQGQWSGIAAAALAIYGEASVRAGLYGSSVDHAPGTFLDALGSILDIRRLEATYSRITATLTGVSGTQVPAGSRARTTEGSLFETLAAVVLEPSGVQVTMRAAEAGAIEAPAGALNRIVTVVAGWETVTNTENAVVGRARQGDAEYRAAYLTRTAHSSVGPMPALEAALAEALAGRVSVSDNSTDTADTIQGWTLGPHSVLVIAEGGLVGDVRRAVENHRGMGVATTVGIVGGTPDNTALDAVSNGTVAWNGTDYTGLDLSGAGTRPRRRRRSPRCWTAQG